MHLILHGETLYIGAAGTGSILAFDIPQKAPRGKLKARVVIDGKLKAPSGFAIGPDGDLYVAERLKQRVRRFSGEGQEEGDVHRRAPGHAGVPGARPRSGSGGRVPALLTANRSRSGPAPGNLPDPKSVESRDRRIPWRVFHTSESLRSPWRSCPPV